MKKVNKEEEEAVLAVITLATNWIDSREQKFEGFTSNLGDDEKIRLKDMITKGREEIKLAEDVIKRELGIE